MIHLTLMGKNKSLLKDCLIACVISGICRNRLFLFKFMWYNYSLIILSDASGIIPLPIVIRHRFVNVCHDVAISIAHRIITTFRVYPYNEEH